jgi:hypothetical protein
VAPCVLVCSIAPLPDERHITGHRRTEVIVDMYRRCAGRLEVHGGGPANVYEMDSRVGIASLDEALRGIQADP